MFSLSLASCEVKENAEAAKKLVKEINDFVGDLELVSCDLMEESSVYFKVLNPFTNCQHRISIHCYILFL